MSRKGKETKPPKYCERCEETVSHANWSRHVIRRHQCREEESQGDMDDLSPSRVFYLRRCAARLGILFCTGHDRRAAEESVPVRDHILSRSDQRICIEVADSIVTSIRTCFARATIDYPMPMSAELLGVQPRRLVSPPASTVTKPTATVSATHEASTAESELHLMLEPSDEETAASTSVPHGSLTPALLQDIETKIAAFDESMANLQPSSQGSLIEPSQIPKERLATTKYATKKKKRVAEPSRESKKSEDEESTSISNVECSRGGSVDVFIAPEERELEEEDNALASCLPDSFSIRKPLEVPVTSTATSASVTVMTTTPELQFVRQEPASVQSEKRATQHVEEQSFSRKHTSPEPISAGKSREHKNRSHTGSSTTGSGRNNNRKETFHLESRRSSPSTRDRRASRSPSGRRKRSLSPEHGGWLRGSRRDEELERQRRELEDKLRNVSREINDRRKSTAPDRR